jgi:tetratricopeptide (TPR) repeat protein
LRFVYGFNHAEAIRSFTRAAELDPTCAMCYWGIALAYGPHVNAPMDKASGVAAYAAAQKALALKSHATAPERAYIEAVAQRYEADPPTDRVRLDTLYARAMERVASTYSKDLDAATLYAESLMDLRPWNYWRPDGTPYPGTNEIVRQLERVLSRNPNHPGACHYYIHAVEAVNPKAAVPCAERLARLMPGEGHMVHMPAHIYIRVGRWNDAVQANQHAIHTDEVFIEGQHPMGVYPLAYYPHNIHFLAFACTMAGRSAQAIEASNTLTSKVNLDAARQVGLLQEMLPYHALTLTTFGKWDDVLAQPLPPEDIRFSYAVAYYARGVAHAAKGQWPEAQAALDTVSAINAATPEGADGKMARARAIRRDRQPARRPRRRHQPLPGGGQDRGRGTLLRTAQVVLPDSALTRRRAGEGGTTCRGREGLSRRPPALPRERLVPLRARAGAPGAGEEARSGRSGSALPPSVGKHGRDFDGI